MIAFSKPQYPGDAVLLQQLTRGEEIGDVRIQQYGQKLRVGTFLPGVDVSNPGDSPKTEPERSVWRNTENAARRVFGIYCRGAERDGWSETPCPKK